MILYIIGIILAGIPILLLWPTRVLHKENRPRRGQGAVLCCNHYVLPDPLIVAMHSRRRLHFVAKREFSRGFGKLIIKWTNSVAVDREKADIGALKRMIAMLKKGKVILMFPEGHRNRRPEIDMLELKRGAVMTAVRARVPLIPMIFYGRPRYFHRNYLVYGKPVDLSEFYGKPLTTDKLSAATQMLGDSMRTLREETTAYLARKGKKAAIKAIKATAENTEKE